ncbi:MAG: hypothetical protein ABIR39_02575 [Nocardioides sp.]|uniref:hypothetical protein n=1 Tax=Nocardioides sp. TaxID=35761 RepID=UPI0032677A2A
MWDDHGNRYDMMDGSGAMLGFGVLVLVLLVVALIAVFANLYLHLSPGRGSAAVPAVPAEPEARRLLDRRLALGEISAEEYASVRSVLES